MTFYTDLAATARNLIRSKGQPMSLVRGGVTLTPAVWGVDLEVPSREVDGVQVLRSDRKIIMESGLMPLMSDQVLIGDVKGAILSIKRTAPAGDAVIYTLQVRAGG